MSLVSFLEEGSKPAQNKIAIVEVDDESHITYEELWSKIHKLSFEFTKLGLHSNDRVILALPNSIDWIVCFLACAACGAVAVPLLLSATAFDIKRIITKTRPILFIGDSSFINRSLPFDLLDEGQRVVILNKKLIIKKTKNKRINELNRLIIRPQEPIDKSEIHRSQDSDIVSISYTYRGYGYPLGAMLSNSNYVEGIKAYTKTAGFSAGERFLAIAPFCYIYPLVGCVLTPIYTGSTIVITHSIAANKLWPIISKYDINVLAGTPSFYTSLAAHVNSDTNTSGIDFAFSGGSLLSNDQYKEVSEKLNIDLRQGYGLTECMPVTCNPQFSNKPGSLGKVSLGSKGLSVRIVDETGRPKKTGEVGEIAVSGPTVMKGYFEMTEEFNAVCQNGWFLTGDLGYFDAEGYLYFSGLKKRITKVGGNMVDLLEVENRISIIPGIKNTRVYAIPDARWGQVVAVDLTVENGDFDERKMRRYLKQYLATYKIPKVVHKIS